ncbi:MAG: hypothetical protein ABIH65_04000 [Nanoarchaeota archaeon]
MENETEDSLLTHKEEMDALMKYDKGVLCELILTCLDVIREKNEKMGEMRK